MRRPTLAVAAGALLALPVVLAFFHGGYDPDARLAAGIAAWLLAAVGAVAAPDPLPRGGPARLALAGLAALFALTVASLAWAPLAAVAYADAQRVALYLGAMVAGVALLRCEASRAVVPALAAGALAIVLVGLSERLFPWLATLERSGAAGGRLQAPLGYWNAMGAVAAIGLALCAGLAGDPSRAARTRALAAAAAPALGAGLVLTFSRGAILAAVAGVVVVLLSRPSPAQLRAAVVVAAGAAIAGVVAALLPAVKDLERRAHCAGRRARGGDRRRSPPAPPCSPAAAPPVPCCCRARGCSPPAPRCSSSAASRSWWRPTRAATSPRSAPRPSASAAFRATASRTGASRSPPGPTTRSSAPARARSRVEWLRERDIAEGARDAHSLPLETAAELGLLGVLALAALVAGVVAAATRLQRRSPGAGAAVFGALAAWSVHVCIDWGWEMPSVSLFAVLLAAALIQPPPRPPGPAPPAPR